jgi:hypothetical protein
MPKSAYKAASELHKLYHQMMKSKVKEHRASTGGRRLTEDERWKVKWDAKRGAEEAMKSRGAVVVDFTTVKGRTGKHHYRQYVVATDKFMSGWGGAKGGKSYYVVLVHSPKEEEIVLRNMQRRSEMKNVRVQSMLPDVGPRDHMHVVDKKEAARFFKEPNKGGFGAARGRKFKYELPKKPSRIDYLKAAAAQRGLTVTTYSPGDGETRYRFHTKRNVSYFSDSGVHTALGYKQATAYLED